MNPFEKQLQLGRELFELNASSAWRQMVELDADSFRTMVETNQSFFARLPEVKDLPGFVSLQREYGETVWNGAQEALKGARRPAARKHGQGRRTRPRRLRGDGRSRHPEAGGRVIPAWTT